VESTRIGLAIGLDLLGVSAPERTIAEARLSAWQKPAQPAETSNAAARDPSNPNSATSQFFINAGKGSHGTENRALDASNATATDGFCVFAVLVSGQRVADRINNNTSTVDPPILVAARILT